MTIKTDFSIALTRILKLITGRNWR